MKLVRYGANMLATVVIGFALSRFIASLPRCLERPRAFSGAVRPRNGSFDCCSIQRRRLFPPRSR